MTISIARPRAERGARHLRVVVAGTPPEPLAPGERASPRSSRLLAER